MKLHMQRALSLGTRVFVVLLIGLCCSIDLAYADTETTVTMTYGPVAGQWEMDTIVGTGPGITWVITNNRPIAVRFCAYTTPPLECCPASRTVGGPNAGEIDGSACIGPGGVGVVTVPAVSCFRHKLCAFQCTLKGGLEEEILDGYGQDYPGDCPPVPTLSEWGMLVLLVLLILSGIIVIRHRRRGVVAR